MSHSFTHLLYHIVFATKERRPALTAEVRPRLFGLFAELMRQQGGIPLAVNGMPDHVHILGRLRQDAALADVVRALKAKSSFWFHKSFPDCPGFGWQTGYGAFTVSLSQADTVRRYIENQEKHHARMTYLDEFRALLIAHGFEISLDDLHREETASSSPRFARTPPGATAAPSPRGSEQAPPLQP